MINQFKPGSADDVFSRSYDVIVIGSGIGGLTSAALLAKAGKTVLVIERHDRPGGYAHGFIRKRYTFDSGVHITSGCCATGYQGGQVIYKVLESIGVADQVEFINVDPFAHAIYPGLTVSLPQSIDQFVEQLSDLFPGQRQGLLKLMNLCLLVAEEVALADEIVATENSDLILEKLATLFKYRRATLENVLDEFIDNRTLQSVFATNWPYLGLPPSKVSFVYWASMFIGYLVDGASYCRGGFQKLANALVNGVTLNGGAVIFRHSVKRIAVRDGKVRSVILESGQELTAPIVISNADMRQTVFELVGQSHFPARFLSKMETMQSSSSIFAVYLATNMDLKKHNIKHESFYYPSFDHDENYRSTKTGEITWFSITVPTFIDPELAPAGEHIVILTTLLPFNLYQNWREKKEEIQNKMLILANDVIPGLKDHICFIDSGTPATMHRYTLNHQGAAYGWDVTPDQVGPQRISNKSPVPGLYFSGHWTQPGGGVYGVCVSGMQTAQQILNITGQQSFWAFFDQAAESSKIEQPG